MRIFTLAVTAVIGILLMPAAAFAGKSKVAITKIDSDTKAEVQGSLKEALAEDFSVVSFKETTKAFDKLGLEEDPTDKDFAKLADSLDAEVIVAGKLDGKGDAKTLKVKLYVKGKKSKKFSVNFGNPKSEKFKKTMHDTLLAKISQLSKSGEDSEEEATPPKKKKKGEEEVSDEEAIKPMKKKKGEEASEDEETKPKMKKKKGGEEDEEEDESPLPKSKKKKVARNEDGEEIEESSEDDTLAKKPLHAAARAAVRVDAGVSAASRTLDFNARQYQQAPVDYKNAIVPGARVAVEMYPAAFSDPKGRAAGLGIWGEFDRTVSLTLQTRSTTDPNQILTAKALQQHWAIGAGYRFSFTKTELTPTLTIGINYARQTFQADTSTLMGVALDLPNTDYKMFQPIVNLRIPFAPVVALVAGGRGMLITDAGAITKGDQYGQAKVFGVAAMGGLDFIFSNRFALRVVGEFSQVGYTFTKGAGLKANNRDGDPNTKDVFGAADRSMGGSVTLGVVY